MAKSKESLPATPEGLAASLLTRLNEVSTSTKAYTMGDHAEHTWGIPIPSLAFQYLIGGSSVLPCQRYFQIGGEAKSYKSTLDVQFALWNVQAGGISIVIDTEHKTSAGMLDAMSWWCTTEEQKKRLIYKAANSIEEWQTIATSLLEYAINEEERPKGKRVPLYLGIDSLMGSSTGEALTDLFKEGHAEARGYPLDVMKVTNWLKKISLLRTTMSVGWVRHLKQSIEPSHTGPKFKEVGGSEAGFRASLGLRVSKKQSPDEWASHPALPHKEYSAQGHQLFIKSEISCLGPDKRTVSPHILWQYIPQTITDSDGTTRTVQRQIMAMDWAGALGNLLVDMKYDDKTKAFAKDIERLDAVLYFTQPKANRVKCEKLGLDGVTMTEFGQAIEANPEARKAVSNILNISEFRSVQDADIDRGTPEGT